MKLLCEVTPPCQLTLPCEVTHSCVVTLPGEVTLTASVSAVFIYELCYSHFNIFHVVALEHLYLMYKNGFTV